MKLVIVVFMFSVILASSEAKVFGRCEFVREMANRGVPRSDLTDWACIAKYESDFNTKAVGPPNSNGSRDYGIFQINSRWWCKPSSGAPSYNECNIGCDALLTDNLSASLKCALKVKKQQGFKAWVAWNNKCQGNNKPKIDDCL